MTSGPVFGSDEAILSLRMRDVDFPIVVCGNREDVTDFSSARSRRQRVGCCETPKTNNSNNSISDYNIYYDVCDENGRRRMNQYNNK